MIELPEQCAPSPVNNGPEALPLAVDEADKIREIERLLPVDYRPRTRYVHGQQAMAAMDGSHDPLAAVGARPIYWNRLALSASPYLQQHAHNPVDWRPWGQQAFDVAREHKRPILLSIGYSTCHWCHVMEHESFEDLQIAALINRRYVAIKVDREERPDIDAAYMAALQAMTGSGGWPMTLWLVPGDRGVQGWPVHAATYLPPRQGVRSYAGANFEETLHAVAELYAADPERLVHHGLHVAQILKSRKSLPPSSPRPSVALLDRVVDEVAETYDEVFGGRSMAPKFPSQVPIPVLLRVWAGHGADSSDGNLQRSLHTWRAMARGGLFDHVGGGWHRYCVDARWFAPHFEKMLYDQALLISAGTELWQASGEPEIATTLERAIAWMQTELAHPQGAWYSATDADSEGHEGRYFLWTIKELCEVLGRERGLRLADIYGCTDRGNFEGSNILHLRQSWPEIAARLQEPLALLSIEIIQDLGKLYAARRLRPPPQRDDKIQASWTALAAWALARAGSALNRGDWLESAAKAMEFVRDTMVIDGQLRHTWQGGQLGELGFVEDYAFSVEACLELLQATGQAIWLRQAIAWQDQLDRDFADGEGAWHRRAPLDDGLWLQPPPDHDGAEPSGSSVALRNLFRLASLTGAPRFAQRAQAGLQAFAPLLQAQPAMLTQMLLAVSAADSGAPTLLLALAGSQRQSAENQLMLQVIRRTYAPELTVLTVTAAQQAELGELVPWANQGGALDGKATAYLCQHGACQLPLTDPDLLEEALKQARLWSSGYTRA